MNAFTRGACAAVVVAIAGVAVAGCKHDDKPKDTTIHVKPGGPGNTPTAVTPTGTVPAHFWINYEFEPKGRRDWVRTGKGQWEERWSNGTVVKYAEDGPYDIGGYNGIMVHPVAGGDYVLLPYGGVGGMVRSRPTKTARNWLDLAEVAGVVKQ